MSAELKPCPFCGGKAQQESYIVEACVFCTSCDARVRAYHEAKEDTGTAKSAEVWNTRAPQWQPIESAPEEVPADEAVIVCVTHDEPRFVDQRMVGEAYKVDGVWWWAGSSPNDYHTDPIEDMYGLGCVTHWQPLPAPPEVQP